MLPSNHFLYFRFKWKYKALNAGNISFLRREYYVKVAVIMSPLIPGAEQLKIVSASMMENVLPGFISLLFCCGESDDHLVAFSLKFLLNLKFLTNYKNGALI